MLFSSSQIAGHCHPQGGRKTGACMTSAVAVVLAFSAQHETIQTARLADGIEPVASASEQFVDISLVAHIEDEMVLWSVEDVVHGQSQLDHAQIGTEVSAGIGQHGD